MLFEAYTALVRGFPSKHEGLYGRHLFADPCMWLAVDAQMFPSFLMSVESADVRHDIELRFVNVRFSRECQIATDDGEVVGGHYTIVRLEENDPDLAGSF